MYLFFLLLSYSYPPVPLSCQIAWNMLELNQMQIPLFSSIDNRCWSIPSSLFHMLNSFGSQMFSTASFFEVLGGNWVKTLITNLLFGYFLMATGFKLEDRTQRKTWKDKGRDRKVKSTWSYGLCLKGLGKKSNEQNTLKFPPVSLF